MILKKRQVMTATLIVALCAAVAVNWYFTKPENASTDITGVNEEVTGNLGDTMFVAGTSLSEEATAETDETTEKSSEASSEINAAEYFASAKLKRQNAYDEAVDKIEDLIDDDDFDTKKKNEISVLINDYQQAMKAQIDAENLITAKTGSNCLVVINGEECQVILEKNTLNDAYILQITEIIEKNTNIFSENLTIIELK